MDRERVKRAIERYKRGDLEGAEALCRQQLERAPNEVTLLSLLGTIEGERGRYREALDAFGRAIETGSRQAGLYLNYALAARHLDELDAAVNALEKAVALEPRSLQARLRLGSLHWQRGELDKAEALLKAALHLSPGNAEAHATLGLVHERRHDLEAAEASARAALEAEPGNVGARLLLAQVEARTDRPESARDRLTQLLSEDGLSPTNRAYGAGRLGKVLDRLGQYEEAFHWFARSKEAISEVYEASRGKTEEGDIYAPESIREIGRFFRSHPFAEWPEYRPSRPMAITFMVGFPRSGTTLLEQVLASHPGIMTLDERPTLSHVMADFLLPPERLHRLLELSPSEIDSYREIYRGETCRFLGTGAFPEDKLVVDKLPMNTVMLGLIWRLFPEARIIWALRDPRAVCLSCFMQTFGPNDAMANLLSLDSIADYYDTVMGLGLEFRDALPLEQHELRYEDLVDDLEGEARRLLDFLGLPWDPAVLDYRRTARGHWISTPSYQQVVRPLYGDAKERWRHYEQRLEPVLPVLRPYLERLGYAR